MTILVRDSAPPEATATFRQQFQSSFVLLDQRSGIGPHHLAIGKSRKVFEQGDTIFALFSQGYEIACARIGAEKSEIRDIQALDFPVAWGGGAFCIDCDDSGRVSLVFLHRNQHELCFAAGRVVRGRIDWDPWRPLLVSSAKQAAPWVEMGPDGTAWCSVLDRGGDFRLVVVAPGGDAHVCNLFAEDEEPWYHSCVQVLPVGKEQAVAVGFRGSFPSKTDLVFKTVSANLALGRSTTLAPCNVNDRLTFHFQALGDAARECAHIVYLDEALGVSHASYGAGRWTVSKPVLPFASFAPQICINSRGDLVLVAADYEGRLWTCVRAVSGAWGKPVELCGRAAPNISARFALTGYGTGGLIAAKKSGSGRVSFLVAHIEDEMAGTARLEFSALGCGGGLQLALDHPLAVTIKRKTLTAEIRLADLSAADLKQVEKSWLVSIPAQKNRALKVHVAAGEECSATLFWQEADGRTSSAESRATVEIVHCDAFSSERCGILRIVCELAGDPAPLHPDNAWVETYDRNRLADIAPFVPETAARMAKAPEAITRFFKRMM